jgi:hypothetical protein
MTDAMQGERVTGRALEDRLRDEARGYRAWGPGGTEETHPLAVLLCEAADELAARRDEDAVKAAYREGWLDGTLRGQSGEADRHLLDYDWHCSDAHEALVDATPGQTPPNEEAG